MATTTILLGIADPEMLADISQALGEGWEATSAATEEEALGQLEERSFDALLVDFNLGSPDASELLNLALEKRPEMTRFLLAYEADLALVAAKVNGSHQILPKPVEPASLKSRLEQGVHDPETKQSGSESTAEAGAAPTIPSIYSELLEALDSPDVTKQQVAEIIAHDQTLTSELLRLTRSAYMGLPRNLTDPAAAVESLGLEIVKALVLAQRFLAEHSNLKPCYLSLEQLWEHSTNVGRIARDLVLFETRDRKLASQALIAGLLHDLGKVVLATNFDDLYGRVHSLARKQPVALWDIEKEMFGASHGEIGACLVGMWNMPSAVVDAAAFHHEPPLGEHEQLTPLAAVHVANVLEHELRPGEEFRIGPIINTAFLNELGLLDRLPVWHAAYANRNAGKPQSQAGSAQVLQLDSDSTLLSRTANNLPSPAATTGTTASGQPALQPSEPASRFWHRRWVYAAAAAGVLFLLAFWPRTQQDLRESAPVYARTPASNEAPAVVPPAPAPEPVPTVQTEVKLAPTESIAEAVTETSVPPASQPVIADPAPAALHQPVAAHHPPPSLPPKQSALPDFRLSGIIYSVVRPSAIVNGKMVYVGDHVNGAKIISITQTEVTLEIDGVIKTRSLR